MERVKRFLRDCRIYGWVEPSLTIKEHTGFKVVFECYEKRGKKYCVEHCIDPGESIQDALNKMIDTVEEFREWFEREDEVLRLYRSIMKNALPGL